MVLRNRILEVNAQMGLQRALRGGERALWSNLTEHKQAFSAIL